MGNDQMEHILNTQPPPYNSRSVSLSNPNSPTNANTNLSPANSKKRSHKQLFPIADYPGESMESADDEDTHDTHISIKKSSISSASSKKQNRNRLSFVCQGCRKSKTKCDREKPQCTRCEKMNLECVYDVAKQPRPRIPNKDATIAKLEKDVAYWQNKAMKLLNQQQETVHVLKRSLSTSEAITAPGGPLNTEFRVPSPSGNALNKSNSNSKSGSVSSVTIPISYVQKTRNVNKNENDTLNDIEINLYKDHPTMIFSKVMKHDVKPLSENYIIIQDRYIAACIASAFMSQNSNSMIPALTANANISRAQKSVRNNVAKLKNVLMKQCTDPARKARIDDFTNRILENTNSSRNLKIGMILSMLYNTVGHQYLEDHCSSSGNYSDLLKSFIVEFERLLPPYDIVQNYKKHFYQYVFTSLPFLQKQMFEESISETITRDPNDATKVKLELGNNHLRDKIENLSILMVILKLSYISLKSILSDDESDENTIIIQSDLDDRENNEVKSDESDSSDKKAKRTDSSKTSKNFTKEQKQASPMPIFVTQDQANKYPITNDFILIAQRCLASENWFACANENIISCLLFIWSFFAFSPEEGDFFLEHPTDIISSLIMMLATSIGLHRDPDDFAQLKESTLSDQRLLNHRRLLWVACVGICSFESTLKGRHPLLTPELMSSFLDTKASSSIKHYMERVARDMTGTEDESLIKIHEATVKRAQLSLLLADLDHLTMSYNDTFSLRYLELSREKIEIFLAENSPLQELAKKKTNNSKAYYGDFNPMLNLLANNNSNSLQSIIMSKLMYLRTSAAIFLHFEVKCLESPLLLPYYYKYLIQTSIDSLNLIKIFNDFFNKKYSNYIYKSNYYNVTKVIQVALPTALFTLIGIIIRLTLTNNNLFAEFKNNIHRLTPEQKVDLNMRFEHTTFIQKELENSLEWMYSFASQNLRFNYFSIFKLFAVADVVLQRIRNGEIWQGIQKISQLKGVHSRITKNLRMTLGVNIEKGAELINDLENRNYIEKMSVSELAKLCRAIHKVHVTLEKPATSSGEEQEMYIPPSVKITLEPKQIHPFSSANTAYQQNIPANTNDTNTNFNTTSRSSSIPIQTPINPYPVQMHNSISNSPGIIQHMPYTTAVDPNNNMNNRSIRSNPGTDNSTNEFLPRAPAGGQLPANISSAPNIDISGNFFNPPYPINGNNIFNMNNAFCNNPNMKIPSYYNTVNDNANNVTASHNGNPSVTNTPQQGKNESIANEFIERTKSGSMAEQPEFFGGFDLFDYDFLFGNDFT